MDKKSFEKLFQKYRKETGYRQEKPINHIDSFIKIELDYAKDYSGGTQ